MVTEKELLTPRQEEALARLRQAPVKKPPLLKGMALIKPPLLYRLIPLAGPVAGLFLIAGAVLLPLLEIPESWGGWLPLKSGGAVELSSDRTLAMNLPQIGGVMVLQGPGRMKVNYLGRRVISGWREGRFTLTEGQLYFSAQPGAPKQILIHTPLLTIRVTGTQFLLGYQAQQGSRLVVVRGEVEARIPGGNGGEWEPVPAGMILSVTPEGAIKREVLRKELPLDDFRLPAVSRRFGSSSAPEDAPPMNLRRLLWYEE